MDNPTRPSHQTGPLPAYQDLIANGSLAADPAQAVAVERLQDLWERLRDYDPEPVPATGGGLLSRLMRRRHAEEYVPTGLYLVGEVGRGKSMLMDLFFDAAAGARASSASISIASCRTSIRGFMPTRRRIRTSPIRSRRWRTRSPPTRRCCASTSSRSTTSPTR